MLGRFCSATRICLVAVLTACTVVGLMPGAVATAASAASPPAAPPWTIQSSPSGTIPNGHIDSVSCSSARACTGVGSYVNRTDITVTLAEDWNGTSWHHQATPTPPAPPAGGFFSIAPALTGVSCPSANFCEAVGRYGQGAQVFSLADVWNGRSWQQQVAPNPPGAQAAELFGVSCASRTFCEAVGTYSNSSGLSLPLAEQWNGRSWSPQSPPDPPGLPVTTITTLTGVSCVSPTFCEAIGELPAFPTMTNPPPFAEVWDGTSWQLQSLPASATQNLGQVSCASVTFCEAVGPATGAGSATGAVWNGTSWATQAIPSPAGAAFSNLTGVSCTSSTFCETVGTYTDSSAASFSWAAAWNGSSWTVQSVPGQPGAALTNLSAVSCSSATGCEAGGFFQQSSQPSCSTPGCPSFQHSLAEGWDGSSWNLQHAAAPTGAASNSLNAVSCPSSTFCETVGSHSDAADNQVSLAEVWNGTSWKIQKTSNPPLASNGVSEILDGVSCVSAHFCEAVGQSAGGPAAQVWNGKSWTMQAVPGGDFLISVSCTSARFCVAVGNNAATDIWNGTSWSAAAVGPPGFSLLGSVSCVSATFCEAIGFGPPGEDAAMWNGTSWAAQSTPGPAGDTIGLNSVSCTTRQFCVTVGNASSNALFTTVTLAEVWNGTAWTVQPTPNPASSLSTTLNGVSCTSANHCTAIGDYGFSPVNTLAEAWDGTAWSLRSTPDVAGASSDVLFAVSCRPAVCTAVGNTFTLFSATLVESGN